LRQRLEDVVSSRGERFPLSERPRSQQFEMAGREVGWLGAGKEVMQEKEEGPEKEGVEAKPVLWGLERHLPHRPRLPFFYEQKETSNSPPRWI